MEKQAFRWNSQGQSGRRIPRRSWRKKIEGEDEIEGETWREDEVISADSLLALLRGGPVLHGGLTVSHWLKDILMAVRWASGSNLGAHFDDIWIYLCYDADKWWSLFLSSIPSGYTIPNLLHSRKKGQTDEVLCCRCCCWLARLLCRHCKTTSTLNLKLITLKLAWVVCGYGKVN